jgi:hypothetical protein
VGELGSFGGMTIMSEKCHVKITLRSSPEEDNPKSYVRGKLRFSDIPKKGDEVAIGSHPLVVSGIEWASDGGEHVPILLLEGVCFPFRGPAHTTKAIAEDIKRHLE